MAKSIHKVYLFSLIAFVLLAFSGISTALVNAATTPSTNGQPNGFTVSPVITEISINKGNSQVVPINISNPTSVTITAQPVVNDFIASADETGTPRLLLNNSTKLPANNFQSLVGTLPKVTIEPNKTAILNVNISVPINAFSGGYYGAVRFVPISEGSKQNVGLTASVGSLFLITVPGNLSSKLSLTQLSAADINGNPSTFFSNGVVSALLKLYNSGNIYTQPYGTIEVKDTFGHIISTTQFNDITPRSSILQQSTRKFIVALPKHKYLGHYTITASIGYGNSGSTLIVESTSFWYIPIWLQIAALIVIVVIIAIIYYIVHRIRSRRFRRT